MPKISVIIPAFNSARFITAAIDSALSQTHPADEIVVVDDGSTDNTRDIVAALPVRYIYQKNAGPSAARNTGIRAATGELLAFLDADDLWLPHKLTTQLKALEARPAAGFSFSTVWNLYEGSDPKVARAPYYPPRLVRWLAEAGIKDGTAFGSVYELLLQKNCVATSSMLAWRGLIERAGFFDLTLRGCEDYDFWIRLARLAPAVFIDPPVSRYRIVDEGLSGAWDTRYERFYDTAVQVISAHMKAYPSLIARKALGASLADYAFFCLTAGRESEARALSARALGAYPTVKGVKTFLEARLPRAYSLIVSVAHLGRSLQR
jgi:glycosyltransferase involved in cell wall biosynthesis